ncbi:MAG TPA: DUF4157 domain-containing protein [Actinomycetota bacterium]
MERATARPERGTHWAPVANRTGAARRAFTPPRAPRFPIDFSRIAIRAGERSSSRTAPTIASSGGHEERAADRAADRAIGLPGVRTPSVSAADPPNDASGRMVGGAIADEIDGLSGAALPDDLRAQFEPRMGADLAAVRIHTDDRAQRLARRTGARALTYQNDVVFAAGEFNPHTRAGRWLLAHELAHAVRGRGDAVLRRPGEDARESWEALVSRVVIQPNDEQTRARAQEAIRRFLHLPSGAALINSTWSTLCGGRRTCGARIEVRFVDELAEGFDSADGHFEETDFGYRVHVENRRPSAGGGITLGGSWPGGSQPNIDIHFTHSEPESAMASTLHHEMLHVWFVNARPDAHYETGHGDVMRGQIDPEFLERLQAFSRELDELEERARTRQRAAPAPARPPEPDLDRTPPAREQSGGPSFVGGEASIRGGFAAGGVGGRVAAIVAADLVLGRIDSFRIGARGVYLTPQVGLVGGTIGGRLLQGETGRPVTNPIFFDVEAGVLAELTPNEADRITNRVAGFGSVGVGQELGKEGPRFFWRVGGYVIVSDREASRFSGGATVGTGVRF